MAKFRIKPKCGNHLIRDGKGKLVTYKAGDIIESDDDLVAVHPNKFERVYGDEGTVHTTPDIPMPSKSTIRKKGKKKKTSTEEKESPEQNEYGIDVTEQFPTASEVDLKVFEKSKWFTVIDPDNNEVQNEKRLRRDKVDEFLAGFLPDADEDIDDEDIDDEEDDDEE